MGEAVLSDGSWSETTKGAHRCLTNVTVRISSERCQGRRLRWSAELLGEFAGPDAVTRQRVSRPQLEKRWPGFVRGPLSQGPSSFFSDIDLRIPAHDVEDLPEIRRLPKVA